MVFQDTLLNWYSAHKRDLPWRHTTDPYQIWLSEVILQQTRVVQGLPYFEHFVSRYPKVTDLANASEDDVLRSWQGLGYYSRARNLHYTAKLVQQNYNAIFPDSYQGLLKLKGIGPYTAAAIASFAYDEKVAVVDGNVYRVLSRYFGIDTDILSPAGIKIFRSLAEDILPSNHVNTYNQAIMEFGALQCTPSNPDCMNCPLVSSCYAFKEKKQSQLPVKIKKLKVKVRFLNYLVIEHNGKLFMNQRGPKDIWQGLYDFCLIETENEQNQEEFLNNLTLKEKTNDFMLKHVSEPIKHQLTHQTLYAKFWHFEAKGENMLLNNTLVAYTLPEIHDLPKPVLVQKYLAERFY